MRWRRSLGYGRGRRRRGGGSPEGGLLIIGVVVFGGLSFAADYVGWTATLVIVGVALALSIR